ncbi:MAG TPA: hypothetical protein VEI48_10890 [Candidatus Sulfotelmatobacter sp.]|nr:hypothetical protein [Candidatus Sulfotelmatobacter sp.]
MTDDDRFEDDVRDVLRDLARDPVPPSLVARVTGIPDRSPGPVSPRFSLAGPRLQWSTALVALVVLALVAGAFVLRGTGPAAGPSPSPTGLSGIVLPSPTPPLTVPPSVVAPTTSPTLTAPPTAAPGVAVPADFQPRSVTFASPTEGWVLGSTACGSARCAVIAHTLDAGRTWSRTAAPATTVNTDPRYPTSGVSAIRFADHLDGWAYGPDLWATHDGGSTWHKLDVTAFAGGPARVWDLEAAAGTAHLAYFAVTPAAFGIASTPATADGWTSPPVFLPVGAGPVPQVQLVIQGRAGWLIQVDREVIDGARLVDGSWSTWTPPCADSAGPAVLAAWSSTGLLADCDLGVWSTPQGEHLFTSANGGTTFKELNPAVPLDSAAGITTPDGTTIVVAGSGTGEPDHLIASFDGGRTWKTVVKPGLVTFTDLGFTTQTQGVVVVSTGLGMSYLLMTRDGGHTWVAVTFSCAPGMFCVNQSS